jgi:hypothetical protein
VGAVSSREEKSQANRILFMSTISKINFFQPGIWEKGALLKEIERNLAIEDDLYAWGKWRPAYDLQVFNKYKGTLGGRPTESFDPNGFLSELGLTQSLTAGRSNIELLRAFVLIDDYRPDARYFPMPEKLAAFVQKTLLLLNFISPHLVSAVDHLINPLIEKKLEEKYVTDTHDPNPYGRFEEIVKGDCYELPKEKRYFGILSRKVPQYAWDNGPHSGSIDPGRNGTENFGTYDIALALGFTESQASRIAIKCYDVDISKTHYHDPRDQTKPRVTGTVGEIGDIHRHYNRSHHGREDTRIMAAKIHLERALRLVDEGYYDTAEQELAIGLHSIQDIFSHCQLTPLVHTLMGEFPDIVKYHPLSMFETALATEGYLKKFIQGLNLNSFNSDMVLQPKLALSDRLIVGNCTPEEKSAVLRKMAEFPEALTKFLKQNGIHIYVGAEGSRLTELGFGMDIDGDGKITPGKWVDINQDGQRQWFEVEDQFDNGKNWNQQPAAYNHQHRMIFLSNRLLEDSRFGAFLKHEINHAIDLTFCDDLQLKDKWKAYINKLYDTARRQGIIAFDELDPHEFFARIEQF